MRSYVVEVRGVVACKQHRPALGDQPRRLVPNEWTIVLSSERIQHALRRIENGFAMNLSMGATKGTIDTTNLVDSLRAPRLGSSLQLRFC